MFPPLDQSTADGYDLQFGTNVLGHFYFTRLLLPILIHTAKTSLEKNARIVTLSSIGAELHKYIDWDTLEDGTARRKKYTVELYFQSKFVSPSSASPSITDNKSNTSPHQGNVVFAQELARKYGKDGIISTAINPGNLHPSLTC